MKKPRLTASRYACVLALLFGAGCTLSGLSNPKVAVPVDHPPGIGIHLTRAEFAPAGRCSAQLANAVKQELLAGGVEVDTATTGTGHILLSLSDTACEAERSQNERDESKTRKEKLKVNDDEVEFEVEYTVTRYTRTTRFNLGISVRASDPRTGEVVKARKISHSDSASNTDVDERPEYPSESPLRRSVLNKAGNDLVQWLLPWTEDVNLVFYDTDECEMGTTYAHFTAGNMDAAAEAAGRSIEMCDSSQMADRFRAAAYYNAGLLHFLNRQHAAAQTMFDRAATINPKNRRASRASQEAGRARKLLEEIRRINALGSDTPEG